MAHDVVAQPLFLEARADAGAQQRRVERLRQVILGAELDAADDAFDLVDRRNHDDGDVAQPRVGAQALEHVVAGKAGHHDVEQDQIGRVRRRELERLGAVRRGLDLVLLAEEPGEERDVGRRVVDREDGLGHACRSP